MAVAIKGFLQLLKGKMQPGSARNETNACSVFRLVEKCKQSTARNQRQPLSFFVFAMLDFSFKQSQQPNLMQM